ncbi:S-adenosyl-L-methionine-dependent methyltransferase [Pilobolus umbonatus]|nr:S-adenosyl-L-methionine-dependent methyltransferase [Pilobolus umbonatus]
MLTHSIINSNYHAPIKEELEQGIHVLDSGCGPATWTLDMAEAYPNSKFTGLDVSCVFPEIVRPPNVQFQICNIAKEIPFADDTFDYFHQRMLVLGLTKNGWNKALENAYRVLKPGGIIELVEPIVRFHCMGPHLTELQKDLGDLLVKKEMVHDIGSRLGHLLRRTGFKEIKVVTRPIPVNHSSKIGELYWQDLYHGYKNLRPMMAVVNPAYNDPQVYLDHLDLVAEECTQMRTNVIFHVTFAQKPFTQ